MKIRYVRECDGNYNAKGGFSKGKPIGVVVKGDNGRFGYAFWNYNKDNGGRLDRKFLIELAAGRATLGHETMIPKREVECPDYPGLFLKLEDVVKSTCSLLR